MVPTLGFVQQKFDEFNKKIFGGRLPRLPLSMADARTFRGICESKVRKHPDGRQEHYDFKIRISRSFDLAESEIEDVIIHEMIHYFISYNGLIDTSPHGLLFRSMMVTINRAHNRNIKISHRDTQTSGTPPGESSASSEPSQVKKGRWHVVGVLYFTDGRTGFKVLPRTAQSLVSYYRKVSMISEISRIELYLTNNLFFDKYPVSVALKYYTVETGELKTHLRGAEILAVEGDRICQTGRSAQ